MPSRSGFKPLANSSRPRTRTSKWFSSRYENFRWHPTARIAVPVITACFCVCEFLRGVDAGVLPSILPSISKELNATSVDAYWVGSVYILTTTIMEPVFAGLSQAIGRRFCLLLALSVFIVANALCAIAPSISLLIGARIIQGIGAGGMDVSFAMIMVDMVSLKERAKYTSALQISVAFGLVSGTLIGALVVQHLSWRAIFGANLPVAVVPLVILTMILHVQQERRSILEEIKSMDWIGIVLFSGSLVSSLWAIFSGGDVFPWTSPRIVVPLVIGLLSLVAFVFFEAFVAGKHIRTEPLVPMRLFGNRTAAIGYLTVLVHAIVMSAVAIYYPLYWFIVDGLSLIAMGIRMLPSAVTPFVCAPLAAILMRRLQRFKLLNIAGLILLSGGMIAMYSLSDISTLGQTIGYQLIYSVGLGILFPTRAMMVQASQPNDDDVPMASSLSAMGLNLGQCLGQALGSSIFQNEWDKFVKSAVKNNTIPESQVIISKTIERSFARINAQPTALRDEYRHIGATAVSYVWRVMVGLSLLALLLSFFVKDLKLDRDTEVKMTFGEEMAEDEHKLLSLQDSSYMGRDVELDPMANTAYEPYGGLSSSRRSSMSLNDRDGVQGRAFLDRSYNSATVPFLGHSRNLSAD